MLIRNGLRTPDDFFVRLALPETPLSALLPPSHVIKDGDDVQIRSRNDKDLTAMYPGIAAAGRRQKINQIVLDGEIVALGEDGRPSFQALQHRSSQQERRIVLYVFDLLYADGQDLRGERLE